MANDGTFRGLSCRMFKLSMALLGLVACGNVTSTPPEEPAPDAAPIPEPETCAPSPAGLKARWRADMTMGDELQQLDGTASSVTFAPGRHGSAFLFDATTDVVTADTTDTLWPTGSFAVEAWVKTVTKPSEFSNIVAKYDCAGSTGCGPSAWFLWMDANGHPAFDFRIVGGSTISVIASTIDLVDGEFHHLVGVRDVAAKKQLLYVDGALAASRDLAGTELDAMSNADQQSDPVTIGAQQISGMDTFDNALIGAVDEVAVYFAAPTADEIAAVFAAPEGICP